MGWFKVLETVLLWVFSVGCGCSFVGFCCMAVVGSGFRLGCLGWGFVGSGSCGVVWLFYGVVMCCSWV